jgi:hypothetical protein
VIKYRPLHLLQQKLGILHFAQGTFGGKASAIFWGKMVFFMGAESVRLLRKIKTSPKTELIRAVFQFRYW